MDKFCGYELRINERTERPYLVVPVIYTSGYSNIYQFYIEQIDQSFDGYVLQKSAYEEHYVLGIYKTQEEAINYFKEKCQNSFDGYDYYIDGFIFGKEIMF